jgi:hypothetical protein
MGLFPQETSLCTVLHGQKICRCIPSKAAIYLRVEPTQGRLRSLQSQFYGNIFQRLLVRFLFSALLTNIKPFKWLIALALVAEIQRLISCWSFLQGCTGGVILNVINVSIYVCGIWLFVSAVREFLFFKISMSWFWSRRAHTPRRGMREFQAGEGPEVCIKIW